MSERVSEIIITKGKPKPRDEIRFLLLRKCPIEAFGSFACCYFGCLSFAMYDNEHLGLNGLAISYGGVYALMTYVFYDITGSHFNPAISFGYFLQGKIDFFVFMMYMVCHMIGGMIAACFLL